MRLFSALRFISNVQSLWRHSLKWILLSVCLMKAVVIYGEPSKILDWFWSVKDRSCKNSYSFAYLASALSRALLKLRSRDKLMVNVHVGLLYTVRWFWSWMFPLVMDEVPVIMWQQNELLKMQSVVFVWLTLPLCKAFLIFTLSIFLGDLLTLISYFLPFQLRNIETVNPHHFLSACQSSTSTLLSRNPAALVYLSRARSGLQHWCVGLNAKHWWMSDGKGTFWADTRSRFPSCRTSLPSYKTYDQVVLAERDGFYWTPESM